MQCDNCGYVFKLDGTEDCISTASFFDVPYHFCKEQCLEEWRGSDEED